MDVPNRTHRYCLYYECTAVLKKKHLTFKCAPSKTTAQIVAIMSFIGFVGRKKRVSSMLTHFPDICFGKA